jgi:septal ring factor EnvC (AmiA/AmiB activator)
MSNTNAADISVFESLQDNAHSAMGMPQSQMAVFNLALFRIFDAQLKERNQQEVDALKKKIEQLDSAITAESKETEKLIAERDKYVETIKEKIKKSDERVGKLEKEINLNANALNKLGVSAFGW